MKKVSTGHWLHLTDRTEPTVVTQILTIAGVLCVALPTLLLIALSAIVVDVWDKPENRSL